MIAQNIGAGKIKRVPKAMATAFFMAFSIAFPLGLVTFLFPQAVFGLFCEEAPILEMAMTYVPGGCAAVPQQRHESTHVLTDQWLRHVKAESGSGAVGRACYAHRPCTDFGPGLWDGSLWVLVRTCGIQLCALCDWRGLFPVREMEDRKGDLGPADSIEGGNHAADLTSH